jgi:hypothetical protein
MGARTLLLLPPFLREKTRAAPSLRGANGSGPKWPARSGRPDDRLRDEAIQLLGTDCFLRSGSLLDCFAALAMTKRKIRKRNADRRSVSCSAPAGAARATRVPACVDPPLRARSPVGVPPRLSPKGVVVPKAQLQAMLPGTWRSADAVVVPLPGQYRRSLCGCYPPQPVPSPAMHLAPGHSAGWLDARVCPGADRNSARRHRTRPNLRDASRRRPS